ncbi:hypothetical protein FRC03_009056 [Tulasnella sp. 419]|nr:hypothetical protein FRC03_009056 [Tulasnella sp. 419]
MNLLAATLHSGHLALMIWGFRTLSSVLPESAFNDQRGGQFQFLTIQALFLSKITTAVCVASDLAPTSKVLSVLRRYLLMIALPLAVVVTSIYWSLIIFLPSLIVMGEPSNTEPTSSDMAPIMIRIPLDIDLVLHLSPLLAHLLQFFLLERKYSKEQENKAPLLAALAGLWYVSFAEWCASYNKTFAYPFLNVPIWGRLMWYAGAVQIAISAFRIINRLHSGYPALASIYDSSKPEGTHTTGSDSNRKDR